MTVGLRLSLTDCVPSCATLTRMVVRFFRSRTKTSRTSLVSPGTIVDAHEMKVTYRPFAPMLLLK